MKNIRINLVVTLLAAQQFRASFAREESGIQIEHSKDVSENRDKPRISSENRLCAVILGAYGVVRVAQKQNAS
jgi:hypothetical protein